MLLLAQAWSFYRLSLGKAQLVLPQLTMFFNGELRDLNWSKSSLISLTQCQCLEPRHQCIRWSRDFQTWICWEPWHACLEPGTNIQRHESRDHCRYEWNTVYCFAKTILAKFCRQYSGKISPPFFRQNLAECKILLIFDLTSSISPSIIGPYGSLLMILTVVHYNGACHVKNCFSTLFAEKHLHFQINLFFHDIGTPNCTLPMSTPLSQKVKIY